jgi:hypothetical protein
MMKRTLFPLVLGATLAATVLLPGCAGEAEAPPPAVGDESEVVSASDAAVVKELEAALGGLETGGGEGDPDPYRVYTLKLPAGKALTPDILVQKLIPKIPGLAGDHAGSTAGYESSTVDVFFEGAEEPNPSEYRGYPSDFAQAKADQKKWNAVRDVVDKRLKNVLALQLGYRGSPQGSIETGAVSLTLAGQTASGLVVAISGIVIWT